MTTKKEEDWQKLWKSVADESDPQRLSELLDQHINELDDRRPALRRGEQQRKPAASSAAGDK